MDDASARALALVRAGFDSDVDRVDLVGVGAWSSCHGFVSDGRALVIKVTTHGEDVLRDESAVRLLRTSEVPVPRVLGTGSSDGLTWAVLDRVTGTPIEEASDDEWEVILPDLLRVLDSLHNATVPASGFGAWSVGIPATSSTWARHLLTVGTDDSGHRMAGWSPSLAGMPDAEAVFGRGLRRLRELSDGLVVPSAIVHADLLHGNVFTDGTVVTGVIDWGASIIGDPLHDHAVLLFWAPWHPGLDRVLTETGVLDHLESVGADVTDVERRLRVCRLHIALEHIAYNALMARPSELDRVVDATEALLTT